MDSVGEPEIAWSIDFANSIEAEIPDFKASVAFHRSFGYRFFAN
jgi:hypothetical protein